MLSRDVDIGYKPCVTVAESLIHFSQCRAGQQRSLNEYYSVDAVIVRDSCRVCMRCVFILEAQCSVVVSSDASD